METAEFYEIRVKGHLGPEWSAWFEGLAVRHQPRGETLLTGPVADQAALHGILTRIRDLGLPLLSVRRVENRSEENLEKEGDRPWVSI